MAGVIDYLLGRSERPEEISVMQPGPVRTERRDGLLGAVSEPLQWAPGPLGIAASLGTAIASGDTGLGLLGAAALKSAPHKLDAIGDVFKLYGKKVANQSIHAAREKTKEIQADIKSGKRQPMTADEIRAEVWRFVGRQKDKGLKPVALLPVKDEKGNEIWVSEIPDYISGREFALPGQAAKIKDFKGAGVNNVNASAIPRGLADIPVESDFLPGSAYGGAYINPLTDLPVKLRVRPDIIGTQKGLDTGAHELQHALSRSYGFFQGGDPGMFKHANIGTISANKARAAQYAGLADIMDEARQNNLHWKDVVDLKPELVSPAIRQAASSKGLTISEAIEDRLEKLGLPASRNVSSSYLRKASEAADARANEGTGMLSQYMLKNKPEQLEKMRKEYGSDAPSFWYYGNQADEGFARASGKRVNKDMEYRIENPFFISDMAFRDKFDEAVWTPGLDDLFYNRSLGGM